MTSDVVAADPSPPVERPPGDPDLVTVATGLLAEHNRAGVLAAADVHLALRLQRLAGVTDERVLLAAALAVRAVREGSVCIDLARIAEQVESERPTTGDGAPPDRLTWPDADGWLAACTASPVSSMGDDPSGVTPLRVVDGRLYLDQYWRQERDVAVAVDSRRRRPAAPVDPVLAAGAVARLFAARPGGLEADGRQQLAAACAVTRSLTVVVGGPGTGKTTTVSRLLAALHGQLGRAPRVALVAPTGKAAARMTQALQESVAGAPTGVFTDEEASWLQGLAGGTVHRLLGWVPGETGRFRHHRGNPLSHDVVVVDEASMMPLTLMSRLVESLRPGCRLVLVGDPDQLASVEAGAVLGDLVLRPSRPVPDDQLQMVEQVLGRPTEESERLMLARGVVQLERDHRLHHEVGDLAAAVRDGQVDRALAILRGGGETITFLEVDGLDRVLPAPLAIVRDLVAEHGASLVSAARDGRFADAVARLDDHRVLVGHRSGPFGARRWNDLGRSWTAALAGPGSTEGEWYPGRPLLVTENDRDLQLWNGDTGVVVGEQVRPAAVFGRGGHEVRHPVTRLAGTETAYALTVHRSQGSQFGSVTVVLPPPDSPLLTRELLYTAITRTRGRLVVVGSETAVRAAVGRPVVRTSGLRGSAGR